MCRRLYSIRLLILNGIALALYPLTAFVIWEETSTRKRERNEWKKFHNFEMLIPFWKRSRRIIKIYFAQRYSIYYIPCIYPWLLRREEKRTNRKWGERGSIDFYDCIKYVKIVILCKKLLPSANPCSMHTSSTKISRK